MSFRLFIYYCALIGGCAAFVGWAFGRMLSPDPNTNSVGSTGIRGLFVGVFIALGLSLVDALWNFSIKQFGQIFQRVSVAVLVGCVGGLLGGMIGQWIVDITKVTGLLFIGWTLAGLLIGTSIGVYDMLASVVRQQNVQNARKKLMKGLIGGAVGGFLGAILFLLLGSAWTRLMKPKDPNASFDPNTLWSPSAWGFVALGMCIGLLIGLAQVILKEAWIRVEKGRRVGRELILNKEQTTIGRAESCDIGLFGDNQIEKLHARIVMSGSRYFLEDAQTPGGTFVNERQVTGRVPLQSGDMIRVGSNVLCFRETQKRANVAPVAAS